MVVQTPAFGSGPRLDKELTSRDHQNSTMDQWKTAALFQQIVFWLLFFTLRGRLGAWASLYWLTREFRMPDGSSQTCRGSIMRWERFHWEALAPAIHVVCYFGTYHLSTQTKHTNLDAAFWQHCPHLNNFYSPLQIHCFSSYLASVSATQQPQVLDGSRQTDSKKARH